jgi:pimeloyl-ACP methyl ester carboxylesterase
VRRILLVACLFAGCAGASRIEPREPLTWRACGGRLECTELPVPIDHARPGGAKLTIAVARRPAEKPAERIGVLMVNPGGPGISAIDHLRSSATRYGVDLRERFDLVAFDTRGTGASSPIDCHESLDAYFAADPTPETEAEWASAVDASRAVADECARKYADLLPFMSTRDSAHDMDLVRAALGEEQLSYLGFSYGTALGASYAGLYPERVRAMVLDGAIEPSFDLLTFAREQAVAVEGALSAYDAEAVKQGWHGVDVLEAVTARAESAPIPASGVPGRAARASDVLYGSVEALTSPNEGWHSLATALGAAQGGDGGPILQLSDGYFQRDASGASAWRVEAQLAVLCADLHRPASAQAFRDAFPEIRHASPHVGVANLMSLLPCAFWVEPSEPAKELRSDPGPPILVVAGSRDPLTPGQWGVRLSEQLAGSARLDVQSDVHTAYGRGGDCTSRIVERVLIVRELPASSVTCP